MFFTFSPPQHVLSLFLIFWRFSASCSYKKGFYIKKRVYLICAIDLLSNSSCNTVTDKFLGNERPWYTLPMLSNLLLILAGVSWGKLFGTKFKMESGENTQNMLRAQETHTSFQNRINEWKNILCIWSVVDVVFKLQWRFQVIVAIFTKPFLWEGRDFVKTAKMAWNLHWSSKTTSTTFQVNNIFLICLFNSRSLYGLSPSRNF